MRLVLSLSLLCVGAAASLSAQVPLMNKVEPDSGKIGSVVRAHGVFLGKAKVDELFLTDQTDDIKVQVLGQTEDYIEFRIPPSVKPGRQRLMVKTTGATSVLLEQPVFVTVSKGAPIAKETAEATAPTPSANGTH